MNIKTLLYSVCPPFLRDYASRIESSALGYRLGKGMFWSVVGAVLSRGPGLVSSVLVARMLGKTRFGELGMIQSTIGMLGVFAGLGLGLTATKHVAEFREKDSAKAGRIIALSRRVAAVSGGVMTLALLFLSPWLATHMLAAPHLGRLLRIGALLLFLDTLNGTQTGALAGFEAFKTIAKVNLWAGMAAFPLMVVGANLAGLEGAVWGRVASTGINWILNQLALKGEAARAGVPLVLSGCESEISVLWSYSLPALLAGIVVGPVTWACNTILVNQPNGYAEMGIFNAANQWSTILMFLPSVLGQAVLPMLSERLGYEDLALSARILRLSIKVNVLVVWPLVLGGSLISPIIMAFYGEGFQQGWLTLVVVFLTAGLLAVQSPIGTVIQASGRMWLGMAMNLGWASISLMSTWVLLKQGWGAIGLALAYLIAYAIHGIWTFGFASRFLWQKPSLSVVSKKGD